jgi:hypothetical protein
VPVAEVGRVAGVEHWLGVGLAVVGDDVHAAAAKAAMTIAAVPCRAVLSRTLHVKRINLLVVTTST